MEERQSDGENVPVYTKCLQVVELIREDINWRKVIIGGKDWEEGENAGRARLLGSLNIPSTTRIVYEK